LAHIRAQVFPLVQIGKRGLQRLFTDIDRDSPALQGKPNDLPSLWRRLLQPPADETFRQSAIIQELVLDRPPQGLFGLFVAELTVLQLLPSLSNREIPYGQKPR